MFCLLTSQLFSASSSRQVDAEKDFDPVRGIALRYNQPIIINNQDRTLWVHNMSRLRGDKDETRYTPEKPYLSIPANTSAPNDHFEVLVTEFKADNRLKNGACLFSLQKIDNPSNTGTVKNGDTVRIISLYAAAGYKDKEGILPNGRILHVENSSRLGDHDLTKELSHFDTFVSDSKFPGTQDDGGKFILQGPQAGTLYSKDLIVIRNKEYKRPLCAFKEGRWGSKFGELVAVRGLDAKDPATQFTINFVDIEMLSDSGQKNLQGILKEGIQTKLFTLSPENSAGNSLFRFNPSLHGGRLNPQFADLTWQFANASDGYVIFDTTPNGGSIKVAFSAAKKITPDSYVLVIGDEKNSSTRLSKNEKIIFTAEGSKDSNAIFPDLTKSSSFWFKISGKTLTAGSGRELGKNKFLQFEETDPEAALVSFVGLAGSEAALFENITINAKEIRTTASSSNTGAGPSSSTHATESKAAEKSSIKALDSKSIPPIKSPSGRSLENESSEPTQRERSERGEATKKTKQGNRKSNQKKTRATTSKEKKLSSSKESKENSGKKKHSKQGPKESTSYRTKSRSDDNLLKFEKSSRHETKSKTLSKSDNDGEKTESETKRKKILSTSKSTKSSESDGIVSKETKDSRKEKGDSSPAGIKKSTNSSTKEDGSGKPVAGETAQKRSNESNESNEKKDDSGSQEIETTESKISSSEKIKSNSPVGFTLRVKKKRATTTDD